MLLSLSFSVSISLCLCLCLCFSRFFLRGRRSPCSLSGPHLGERSSERLTESERDRQACMYVHTSCLEQRQPPPVGLSHALAFLRHWASTRKAALPWLYMLYLAIYPALLCAPPDSTGSGLATARSLCWPCRLGRREAGGAPRHR